MSTIGLSLLRQRLIFAAVLAFPLCNCSGARLIVQDYGSLSVVPAQQDTARPPVPTELNLPQDSVLTVAPPGDTTVLYYRNIVGIAFVDSASGPTVRALVQKYNAVIIGGAPYVDPWGAYIVRVPDPGTTFGALDSLLARIDAEPAVAEAFEIAFRDTFDPRGRYPADGSRSLNRPRVPLTAPDTVPAWVYAPENLASDTGASYEYFADVIIVAFNPSATQADRQAAIDTVSGEVVGGHPMPTGEGFYYVRLNARRRLEPLVRAVMKLWSLPHVGAASLVTPLEEQYRRPEDQGGFASWDTRPDSAVGRNWGLGGAAAAPAWGCATGWSQGYVQSTCVNVSPAQGVAYYCQMYANYGQDNGDSGAPILLDINGGADSTVTLGGIHSGKAGKNAVFSPWSGIVQDYGTLSVVPAPQDTTRPPVPLTPNLPDDSTFTVPSPSGTAVRYYRNIVVIAFDDSTSGVSVRRILAKFSGVIIGGSEVKDEPAYYVKIPDPGATFAAIDSVASLIEAEPGVKWVYIPTWRGLIRLRSRYPEDGPQSTRADWFSPTNATRARLAIRATLAWGCETGTYASRPKLGVIDWVFNAHTDLEVADLVVPSALRFVGSVTVDRLEHGNKVAGIVAATGDNRQGVAGVAWGSQLHLYALGTDIREARDPIEEYRKAFEKARKANVRVLTASVSIDDPTNKRAVPRLQAALEKYLEAGNVFVYALENHGQRLPVEQVRQTQDTLFTSLDRAVAGARQRFGDRIITVAGTGVNGALLGMSDFWIGGTDVVAPGEAILTLAHSNNETTVADSGNSFAAPFVAGTAALLLAMDPTLTADEVKDFILRGAQVPRWNPQTRQLEPAQPVTGAPDTVYQLDAYGALKLAAERSGTPLCGNRVWATGRQVVVQRNRSSDTQETLHTFGENVGQLNVYHGGRRIEAVGDSSSDTLALAYDGGTRGWRAVSDAATTMPGGTYLSSLAIAHDADSAADITTSMVGGQVTYTLRIVGIASGEGQTLSTMVASFATFAGTTCILERGSECIQTVQTGTQEDFGGRNVWAFSPLGDRVLFVAGRWTTRTTSVGEFRPCPWSPDDRCRTVHYERFPSRTEVYSVNRQSGDRTLITDLAPSHELFYLALAEDGTELVTGQGHTYGTWGWEPLGPDGGINVVGSTSTLTGCGVEYRNAATAQAIASSFVPSEQVCTTFFRGRTGTIAPAPPTVTSR